MPAAASTVSPVNPGVTNASAKCAAEVNRSAGSLASALSTDAATWGGTVSRDAVTGGAFSVITLATNRLSRRPHVGRIAGQHLVKHGTHRIHVAPRVQLPVAHGLLGTHVLRRADGKSRFGKPCTACLAYRQRDAEVSHLRLALHQQDVFGLDVPVDHPLPMGVVQRPGDGPGEFDGVVNGELFFTIELGSQRLALDVRHDVVEESRRFTRIVQRQNVGVLQVGGDFDFLQEPLGPDHGRQLRLQDLERHLSIVLGVVGQIHGGHATLTEFALDDIAVNQGGTEFLCYVLQWPLD